MFLVNLCEGVHMELFPTFVTFEAPSVVLNQKVPNKPELVYSFADQFLLYKFGTNEWIWCCRLEPCVFFTRLCWAHWSVKKKLLPGRLFLQLRKPTRYYPISWSSVQKRKSLFKKIIPHYILNFRIELTQKYFFFFLVFFLLTENLLSREHTYDQVL